MSSSESVDVARLVDAREDTIEEDEVGHFLKIISRLMFTYGDSHKPLVECQRYLLRIVYTEMREMIYVAKRNTDSKRRQRRNNIDVADLVFQFRRHPPLLRRLIKYIGYELLKHALLMFDSVQLKEAHIGSATMFNNVISDEQSGSSGGIAKFAMSHDKNEKRGVKAIRAALSDFDVHGQLVKCLEQGDRDPIFDDTVAIRKARFWERCQHMPSELYEQFSGARRYSFLVMPKKKPFVLVKKYVKWLKAERVTRLAVWILNFCSLELVACITEMAVISRRMETATAL
ncbi:hypothetical protein QR680_005593 [Steinernema hermaphroditum]|uniref:Uncharacterized protein n=1 Tax=Steinernema hermaphroditum TaxID=289476 RepID=A0AA39LVY6_9BILA|nr:hypothetical protein QR680_005593 [Steinernema hermaphroditum]